VGIFPDVSEKPALFFLHEEVSTSEVPVSSELETSKPGHSLVTSSYSWRQPGCQKRRKISPTQVGVTTKEQ
jgi:hypothetical protein